MDMQNIVNNLKSTALTVGEMLTPILKQSKFRETGVLTPEEFVVAGDHLVYHCSTWKWSKAADPSRVRSYLPEDKQFLIVRNVPCHKRCRQMEYDPSQEKILSAEEIGAEEGFAGDEDSGWVDTHYFAQDVNEHIKSVELDVNEPEQTICDDDVNEAAMDLDDFVESGGLEDIDPNRYVAPKSHAVAEVERPRTYDLHITYDKYYQVPRLFLMGYNENRKPLTIQETYEDFSADHANKTITVETHPHIECDMPTVHPCRHAEMMKRLLDQLEENGKELEVHEYLLIFLKFVQAVIPTIEYDYTRSIQL
ncbi:autophagocytosis associated protein [Dictyocaulus viviparus]|uniref:Ubiquitin-like-conjugating enzyme ATG3 n=1 Tax=Dictyocaulus viviparus TaxID=29172 RepID=A0A0D8XG47_DICVI|nr:autophagocytosis associated protein [Dictyocaulus viviparus]